MGRLSMKIKRFILCPDDFNLIDHPDTDAVLDSVSMLMDRACANEIIGGLVFEGEDGKFYTGDIEFNIREADQDRVKNILKDMDLNG